MDDGDEDGLNRNSANQGGNLDAYLDKGKALLHDDDADSNTSGDDELINITDDMKDRFDQIYSVHAELVEDNHPDVQLPEPILDHTVAPFPGPRLDPWLPDPPAHVLSLMSSAVESFEQLTILFELNSSGIVLRLPLPEALPPYAWHRMVEMSVESFLWNMTDEVQQLSSRIGAFYQMVLNISQDQAYEISRLALEMIYPNHCYLGPSGRRMFPRTFRHQTDGPQAPETSSSKSEKQRQNPESSSSKPKRLRISSIGLGLEFMAEEGIEEFGEMLDNVESLKDWMVDDIGDDFFDFSTGKDANTEGLLGVLPSPESDPNVGLTPEQMASVISFANRITDAFQDMVNRQAGYYGLTLNFQWEDANVMARRLISILYPNHPMLGRDGPPVLD